jgi:ergothioneine biosynthesis protein EgtB
MRTERDVNPASSALASRFAALRALSADLVAPLSDADATIQSMDDASPAKWHLAHTTWFFETFVLRDHVPGYRLFDARWPFLFNSYYEAEGQRHARPRRGMLSRPSLAEILDYREAVNAALLAALPDLPGDVQDLVELGCHHEEQHQELLLTDILHHFSVNPLEPAIWPAGPKVPVAMPAPIGWIEGAAGPVEIGCGQASQSFTFDCERPRHTELLHPHALADRTVTNGEWAAFIADGGYRDSRHWLADGWAWVQAESVVSPLYWKQCDGGWTRFGLDGRRPVDPAAPVTHVSFFEADAYASWAGTRLRVGIRGERP